MKLMITRGGLRLLALLLMTSGAGSPLAAQQPATSRVPVWGETFVGSEPERYLRLLQIGGGAEAYPVSVRGWGIREVAAMAPDSAGHPWASAIQLAPRDEHFAWVRPSLQLSYNSAFPYGGDDGAVWAGKGITAAIQAGASARYGPLSVTVAPIFFRSQNASFPLTPNGLGSSEIYNDPRTPIFIDLPQRFGDDPYGRFDLGQSTLRIDLAGFTVGASTANQQWGPARQYPIILGPNAGGYAHVFLGTSTPRNIWIGELHGRLVWGALEQSPYSPMPESDGRRLMSGVIAIFTPRGVPGLEIGGSRFFHLSWPDDGISAGDLFRPFESLLKSSVGHGDELGENQLASAFIRWAFPRSGLEVYGEFAREDHNYDLRDLILEPDHVSAFLLGLQKIWTGDERSWSVLRAEFAAATPSHLHRVRPQPYFYQHSVQRQGHTHRGQLLGSPVIYGGGGAIVAFDRYHRRGRLTAFLERSGRQDWTLMSPRRIDRASDAIYALGTESVFFRGRYDLFAGLTGAWNLNRDARNDVVNWNVRVGLKAGMD